MIRVIHGENNFQSWLRLRDFIDPDTTIVDGSDLENSNPVIGAADSLNIFSGKSSKLIVKRLSKNRKKTLINEIVNFFIKQKLDITFWEDKKLEKSSYIKLLDSKYDEVEEYQLLGPTETMNWISAQFADENLTIDSLTLQTIVQTCGSDQWFLNNEIQKLILFAKSENLESIDERSLVVLSPVDSLAEIWDLTDALVKRNRKQALTVMQKLFRSKTDFVNILYALTKQLKLLFLLKKGIDDKQIMKVLGYKNPYPVTKAKYAINKFETNYLRLLFKKLVNLDLAIREGRMDTQIGLSLLLATL